jgi:predicted nucleotidyltransferase
MCDFIGKHAPMDFVRPVEALVPGVQGRILAALARTDSELTISAAARLAEVSVNRATTVVNNLVSLGLVERREAGSAALIRLARDNEAAHEIVALADIHSRVVDRLRAEADRIRPVPASLALFGSFARGEARADSDIDVLVVRPAHVAEDDAVWTDAVGRWADRARTVAGNPVNLIEAAEDELPKLLNRRGSLWQALAQDAVVLVGAALTSLPNKRGD